MKKCSLIFLFLLGADIVSKMIAIKHIPAMLSRLFGYPYGGIPLFDWSGISFSLNTIYNTGAAWGIFQGYSGLLFVLRAVIIGGLMVYLLSLHRSTENKYKFSMNTLPLWLVTIGAIGNSIDYLAYGHVVDFLHFCFWGHSFPIFNLADCYITIGVFALLLIPRKEPLRTLEL